MLETAEGSIGMESAEALGIAIDAERVTSRLTREELAEASGISLDTIGDYIRGEREPSLAKLRVIARVMELSAQDLLDRADVVAGRVARRASVSQDISGDGNLVAGGDINIDAGALDIKAEGRS